MCPPSPSTVHITPYPAPARVPAQAPPPTLVSVPGPHPPTSTWSPSSPRRFTPSNALARRKRKRNSQDENPQPPTDSQVQVDPDPNISITTTTTTTKYTSRMTPIRSIHALTRSFRRPRRTSPTQQANAGYPEDHVVSLPRQSHGRPVGEPSSKRRRLDGGQSPYGVGIAQQQEQPTTENHSHQQAYQIQQDHWYRTGAQQTTSQLPLPAIGHTPTSDGPSHSNHFYAPVHTPLPTRTPMGANPNPSSGQDQYHYSPGPGPAAPAQLVQMPGYLQSRSISPTYNPLAHLQPSANVPLASPSAVYSNAGPSAPVAPQVISEPAVPFHGDDPIGYSPELSATDFGSSHYLPHGSIFSEAVIHTEGSWPIAERTPFNSYRHQEPTIPPWYNQLPGIPEYCVPPENPLLPFYPIPPWHPSSRLQWPLPQAYPTAYDQDPNTEVVQNGGDISNNNIDINSANNARPTSSEPGRESGPNRNRRPDTRRGPYQRPVERKRPVEFQGNLQLLLRRVKEQGAEEGALVLLGKIFATEISLNALTRSLTDSEVETKDLGVVTGKVYTALLRPTHEGEDVPPRFTCRLCDSEQSWKHIKDVVRHLRRDHIGLADVCKKWYVLGHPSTLAGINGFPGGAAIGGSIPLERKQGTPASSSSALRSPVPLASHLHHLWIAEHLCPPQQYVNVSSQYARKAYPTGHSLNHRAEQTVKIRASLACPLTMHLSKLHWCHLAVFSVEMMRRVKRKKPGAPCLRQTCQYLLLVHSLTTESVHVALSEVSYLSFPPSYFPLPVEHAVVCWVAESTVERTSHAIMIQFQLSFRLGGRILVPRNGSFHTLAARI